MLLEELNSKEAKEYRRKQTRQAPNSSENSTSFSSEAEVFDDSTTDLMSSMVSVKPEEIPNDYDVDATTTNSPEGFNEAEGKMTSSKPKRPMMLSEFASHLANGIREKTETTTQPLPDFPTPKPEVFSESPDEDFPFIVTAAKDFVRRYLSPEQWRKLRILLKTIKEVGGTRRDIHRAATSYISKVISKTEMAEITERKNELFRTFNRRYFDKIRGN